MSTSVVAYDSATLTERQSYAQTLAAGGDLIPKGLHSMTRRPDGSAGPSAPSPGKVLLVMETGAMLGLHPIAALQGVHIIEGRATLSPALMSAVVRKAGHRLRVSTEGDVKAGTFTATAELTRSDDPDFTYRATWSIDRATRAGLASKDVWKKYPEAMCKARAISEVCREGAEDALMGVHYTPEEIGGEVGEAGEAVGIPTAEPDPEPTEDWGALIVASETREELDEIAARLAEKGEGTEKLRAAWLARAGFLAREAQVVDAEIVDDEATGGGGAVDGDHPEATRMPATAAPGPGLTPEEFEAAEAARFDAEADAGEVDRD